MKIKMLLLLSMIGLQAIAQTDSIVMTINGKAVTRSEFEYAYQKNNKNGRHIKIANFAKQYALYKQKVAAAEEARLDKTASFNEQVESLLSPTVAPVSIPTVSTPSASLEQDARRLYNEERREVEGNGGLVSYGEILIRINQHATAYEEDKARVLADSVYRALQGGADFETLAKKYSQTKGGRVFTVVGRNEVLEEVEKALFSMQAGELRAPVTSPFGFHILKVYAREQYPAYEVVRPRLIKQLEMANLRQQIIRQQQGQSVNTVVLAPSLDTKGATAVDENLKREVCDGLLVAAITHQKLGILANNRSELERYFRKHRKEYRGVLKGKSDVPKSVDEVLPLVENDYQQSLEKGWEKELKRKYKVVVNKKVLSAINHK